MDILDCCVKKLRTEGAAVGLYIIVLCKLYIHIVLSVMPVMICDNIRFFVNVRKDTLIKKFQKIFYYESYTAVIKTVNNGFVNPCEIFTFFRCSYIFVKMYIIIFIGGFVQGIIRISFSRLVSLY